MELTLVIPKLISMRQTKTEPKAKRICSQEKYSEERQLAND
jgi:hypothetical protein